MTLHDFLITVDQLVSLIEVIELRQAAARALLTDELPEAHDLDARASLLNQATALHDECRRDLDRALQILASFDPITFCS